MKMTVLPIVNGALGTITKGIRELGNKRTSRDHPDYSIIKISQNTEKSPGDLRKFAVTQNSSEKPLVNAGVKNFQRSNNNR